MHFMLFALLCLLALAVTGIRGFDEGYISDQTQLLQDIRDGLAVYNMTEDPIVAALCEPTIRQTLRAVQAPKKFQLMGDGGYSNSQKNQYRLLNVPFKDYDVNTEFTIRGLQDMLPSDARSELTTSIQGDVQLVNSLMFAAIFTKQTVGSVGTAYQSGFWNGETDVPDFQNNSFGSAHYHYLGLNTTTLAKSHIQDMKADIQEHGFGLTPGSLLLLINTDETSDVQGLMDTNASNTILQAVTMMRERAIDQGMVNTGVVLEGAQVVVTDNVPSGYLGMVASDVMPLARREHVNAAYRGLQPYWEMQPPENYPLAGMKFMRRIGFAVQLPGAGTCRQLVASTTYSNPTFLNPAS
jgi:hypothetical protein